MDSIKNYTKLKMYYKFVWKRINTKKKFWKWVRLFSVCSLTIPYIILTQLRYIYIDRYTIHFLAHSQTKKKQFFFCSKQTAFSHKWKQINFPFPMENEIRVLLKQEEKNIENNNKNCIIYFNGCECVYDEICDRNFRYILFSQVWC